jgi:hypothetical protein
LIRNDSPPAVAAAAATKAVDVAAVALRVAGTEPREARQLPVAACFTLPGAGSSNSKSSSSSSSTALPTQEPAARELNETACSTAARQSSVRTGRRRCT